jgi:hypothetical protein
MKYRYSIEYVHLHINMFKEAAYNRLDDLHDNKCNNKNRPQELF